MENKKTHEGASSEPTGVVVSDGKKHRNKLRVGKKTLVIGGLVLILIAAALTYWFAIRQAPDPIVVGSTKAAAMKPEEGASKANQAGYYVGIANAMVDEGNYSGAVTNFEKAKQLDGSDYLYNQYLIIAKAYKETGNKPKATEAIKKALQVAKSLPSKDGVQADAVSDVNTIQKELGL